MKSHNSPDHKHDPSKVLKALFEDFVLLVLCRLTVGPIWANKLTSRGAGINVGIVLPSPKLHMLTLPPVTPPYGGTRFFEL